MTALTFPVSFTAPSFSEEDFKQEMSNLTPEQAYNLECHRRGISPMRRETQEMRENGLRDLETALTTLEDRMDYVRACEVAPTVVQQESDPLFFLRCEDYDANAAAARLTAYWRTRCRIFGDRAFRPLTLSGDGALTAEDVEDLKGGSLQLLEPDDMGRSVIYYRRALLTLTQIHRPVVYRNAMYLFAQICKDPVRQRHGYVLIVDTRGYPIRNNDRKAAKKLCEFTRYATPVRPCCVHLCYADHKCLARLFLPTILWFMGQKLRQTACIHSGGPKELMFDLALYGMDPHTLPNELAGDFSLALWQETVDKYRDAETEEAA